jgi:hypothetical protein
MENPIHPNPNIQRPLPQQSAESSSGGVVAGVLVAFLFIVIFGAAIAPMVTTNTPPVATQATPPNQTAPTSAQPADPVSPEAAPATPEPAPVNPQP